METPCSPGTHSRRFSLRQCLCGEDKGNEPRLPRSQRKGNHRDHIQPACQCSIPSKPLVPLPQVPHTGRCCLLQCLESRFLFLWLNISHSQPESSCSHSRDAPGFPPPSQPSWVYLWSMTKVPLALALSGCSSQFLGLLSANIPAIHLLFLGFTLLNVGDEPWRWSLRDGCVTSLSTQQNSFLTPLEMLHHPRMVGW